MTNHKEPTSRSPGFFGKILCKHNWVKRENWHQQDRAAHKIAYKCSFCGKVVKRDKFRT